MPTFTTRSIAAVAALALHDIRPAEVGRDGAGKHLFFFDRTEEVLDLMARYHADTLALPARQFARALKDAQRTYITRH